MHIGHLARTTMTQQDQESGITCIAYLSNIVKTMFYNVLQYTNIICERATSGPGVRAHGPQSQFRLDSVMRLCGKLLDIWLTPSGVVASQMLLSQQISCISLAVFSAAGKMESQEARAGVYTASAMIPASSEAHKRPRQIVGGRSKNMRWAVEDED